jgi:hypothetical protein
MGAVAEEAGVVTGTAYVNHESRDELVYATSLESKAELGAAVLGDLDATLSPFERWRHCSPWPTTTCPTIRAAPGSSPSSRSRRLRRGARPPARRR